jgi:hypothetical protein
MVAPVVTEIDVRARMLPAKAELVPSVGYAGGADRGSSESQVTAI